ncbi:MAG: recombinase family protein [Ramlibacter sp.]
MRMSTDHQRYSIDNQSALIGAYAATHQMRIVRSYADPGRSGLTMRERPALAALLSDAISGRADFEVVLVYDVSRWGRFQDVDESAHYEFLCRRAGIRVVYCAEQFTGDGTPFGSVLKALKRAMAGEYSRELSVKVAAGKARIGRMGFRVGGIAGYGLRRRVLEDGRTPGILLNAYQRKSIQTDRVTLVPGPPEEIALVHRMYRDYVYRRRSERQIAAELNSEGRTFYGRPWSRNLVRSILQNEKYIGNNIVGQIAQRLAAPTIIRPPQEWTRCDGAFEPIVSRALFDAAARVRRFNEKTYVTREEIVAALKVVLAREGKLTAAIINAARELPSANTVEARFGSLGEVYEAIGYRPAPRYSFHALDRGLRGLRTEAQESLVRALFNLGLECSIQGPLIKLGAATVAVMVCRHQTPRIWQQGWRIDYQTTRDSSVLVALRMAPGNQEVHDVLVVARSQLAALPLFIQRRHDAQVAPYICQTPAAAARAISKARAPSNQNLAA